MIRFNKENIIAMKKHYDEYYPIIERNLKNFLADQNLICEINVSLNTPDYLNKEYNYDIEIKNIKQYGKSITLEESFNLLYKLMFLKPTIYIVYNFNNIEINLSLCKIPK